MFNIFNKSSKTIEIYSPLKGELLPLSASPDAAFAEGMMGEGLCISPSGDTIYAPLDSTIDIFHTLHAVGFVQSNIELIVHVGMNTVSLNGEGFTALVPLKGHVSVKTPLIKFDPDLILSKVETLITPVIVIDKPDTANVEIIKESGSVEVGDLIMRIKL